MILDPQNSTQDSVFKQSYQIPERKKPALVYNKVKIEQAPYNLVATQNTYRMNNEALSVELLNETVF